MTAGRHRALAALLFATLVATACGAGAWAWSVREGLGTELAAKRELYETLRRIGPRASLPAEAGDLDRRDPYLSGPSETIAAAELQRRVRALIEAAGGQVFSSQLLMKAEPEAAERRIELQVVFEGRVEAVQKALFEIETGAPFGFVDEIALAPARADRVDDPEEAGRTLRAAVSVSGFWRRPS